MQIEKPVMPLGSNFNWTWHYSFQERIIETKNKINIPWMNSLVREWSQRINGFDCKNPNCQEANQLAIWKHNRRILTVKQIHEVQPRSQGFSFLNWVGGPNSKRKSPGNEVAMKCSQWDLNLEPKDSKANTLTTWPRCLHNCVCAFYISLLPLS